MVLYDVWKILGKGGTMSIVTIKWTGQEGEKPYSQDFEYTGGCGFMIYQNLIHLLTAIDDNFENPMKQGGLL